MKRSLILSFFVAFTILTYNAGYSAIVVKSTKGEVAYKKGRLWKPLTKNMKLAEGTKISTGIRSWAVIKIDRHTLKIRQLTMMKIYKNKKTKKRGYTHLGLKRGSLNARVKRIGRLKTSFKITTPVATSSVRGTEEEVSYGQRRGMVIKVIEGVVAGENIYGVLNTISGRSVFRLKPDSPRPDNLLSDVRDESITKMYDDNITADEKDASEYNGDDIIDNSEGGAYHMFIDTPTGAFYASGTTPSGTSTGGTSTEINISLQWPEKK